MGSYLQTYGAGEERRENIIKWIVISCVAVVVLGIAGYYIYHNYPEKRVANNFLADLNAHNYQAAYRDWGCTDQHPCPNYNYERFMNDWGPNSKATTPWKVASVDGCKYFVTVNVAATGAEMQSLAVQRADRSLGFAPASECQEKQWRWGLFFRRLFGREPKETS